MSDKATKAAQDKLAALQKKYEGLTQEELLEKLAQFDAETASMEAVLKAEKKRAETAESEAEKLRKESEKLKKASSKGEAAKRQGALQQKYFDKTFPAQIEGSVKLNDGDKLVEVTIMPGVSHIVHVSNIMGDFNVSKLQIGTDKEGKPILTVVKDNFNRIRLAPVMQYADKVPAFKELLQKLYDEKINVLADTAGNALFEPGGSNDTETILKID
jgi:hypothetical protein